MATVGSLLIRLGLNEKGFTKGLKGAESRLQGFRKSVRNAGAGLTAGLTLPLAAVGTGALRAAIDFNSGMAKIATLIPGNIDRVNQLKNSISDLSVETGKSVEDLTGGAFQLISAFGDSAASVDLLTIATKASIAGLSTTEEAINLISGVTKGYGDVSEASAQKVSDLAFVTNKLGQTTFPELAASLGRVVPIAAELGVTQEELFGVFATATGVTGKTTEVSTQLRGVLQSLLAPTADMTKLLERNNIASGKALLRNLGLKDSLKFITQEAIRTGQPLQKFISQIEGQTLALALTGSQADTFAEKLMAMQDVTGATTEAFLEQTQGINKLGFGWERLKQQVNAIIRDIGDILSPVVQRLNTLVSRAVGLWGNLTDDMKLAITTIGVVAAAFGPLLIALSLIFALLSPWALLVIVIGNLALVGWLVVRNWEVIGPALERLWLSIFVSLRKLMSNFNNDVVLLGETIAGNIRNLIGEDMWGSIKDHWDVGLLVLSSLLLRRTLGLGAIWRGLVTVLKFGGVVGVMALIAQAWERDLGDAKGFLEGFRESVERHLGNVKRDIEAFMRGSSLAGALQGVFSGTVKAGPGIDLQQFERVKTILPTLKQLAKDTAINMQLLGEVLEDQIVNFGAFKELSIETMEAMRQEVVEHFNVMVQGSVKAVNELKDSVIELFNALDEAVVGGSIVPDMVNGIVGQFDRLNTEVVPLVRTATSNMETEFINAAPAIGTMTEEWQNFKDTIAQTEDFQKIIRLLDDMKNVLNKVEDAGKDFQNSVKNIPQAVNSALTDTTEQVRQQVSFWDVLFKDFKFNIVTVFTDIRNAAVFTWGAIQSQFVSSLAGMIQGTATFKEFMQQFWNTLLQAAINTFITIGLQWAIQNLFMRETSAATLLVEETINSARLAGHAATESAKLLITEVNNKLMLGAAASTVATITALGLAALGVAQVMVTAIAAIFTAIAAALAAGTFTAIFAQDFATAAAGIAIGGTAAVIAGEVAVAAAGKAALGVIGGLAAIPALHEGGIVTGPTLAQIGEGGQDEAVIPLDRLDSMIGGREQTLLLEVDGRRLMEKLIPQFPKVVRMKLGAAM